MIKILVLTILFPYLIFSTPVNSRIINSKQQSLKSPFYKELNSVDKYLYTDQYQNAIYELTTLISKIKNMQTEQIEQFFPKEFNGFFETSDNSDYDAFNNQSDNYGTLYSKQYQNENGHTIDLSVIYSDPSISEYINIIRKPTLIDNFENTTIVKVNDQFNAIEKYVEENMYLERNIVINKDLLIVIIANGVEEKAVVNDLFGQINLTELKQYLAL